MSNAFTSIATAGGWQTNTVTSANDLYFRWALRSRPTFRQMVDVRPEQPTHRGSSQILHIAQYFASGVVTTAKTPLNEESDPDSVQLPADSTVTLTPTEYGLWVMRTEKLEKRSMVQVDPVIGTAVAASCADVIDELVQDALLTSPTNTLFDTTNSHSTIGTTTAADNLRADVVRRAVLGLRVRQAVPTDGGFYTAIAHPAAIFDLRTETGQGGWRQPNEYGTDQSRIWNGEVGAFEGVHFIESPRARTATDGAASAVVRRTFFFGQEALAESVVTEPGLRVGPYTDSFNRFRKLGWYMDIAWKTFRQEALVVAYTSSKN